MLDVVAGDAVSVVRSIIFNYFYVYGFVKTLISDRGGTYVARITQLLCYVFCVRKKELKSHSHWTNPAEPQMGPLGRIVRMNRLAHHSLVDGLAMNDVYQGLDALDRHPKVVPDLHAYCAALQYSHNNIVSPKTGFSPNQLRFGQGTTGTFLECALNLRSAKMVPAEQYLERAGDMAEPRVNYA